MSWLCRISQTLQDTSYWGRSFLRSNPDYEQNFDVYQSSDFPNVFLGGEDDLAEAEAKAGAPMCKIIDCRDLPEVDGKNPSWDYAFFTSVQGKFNAKVEEVISSIQSLDCPIFVHCALGANRSVAVLASALSRLTNKSIDGILGDMKQSRMVVNPQDPYYLMSLEQGPAEDPEILNRRFLELDQDFPLVQPESLVQASTDDFDMIGGLELVDEERQWRRAITTPGFPVVHDDGWLGTVIECIGDPVNGGKVVVKTDKGGFEGPVLVNPLQLSPSMKVPSPFSEAKNQNWLQKMSDQKLLIISRGPSGSGKSHMSSQLGDKFSAPIFSTDDFFQQSGTYEFDPNLIGEAHEWNRQRVNESITGGTPIIIVDNTNAEFWEMKPYVQMAQKYGYRVDFKEPEWNTELRNPDGSWNVDFLESMQNQPGRDKVIPREVLEGMVGRYQHNATVDSVLQSERPENRT